MINRLIRILAVLLISLGTLWSLQGAGIVHIAPIACVADCVELQGASAQWLVAGLVAIVVGAMLWFAVRRRARNSRSISK